MSFRKLFCRVRFVGEFDRTLFCGMENDPTVFCGGDCFSVAKLGLGGEGFMFTTFLLGLVGGMKEREVESLSELMRVMM